MKYTLNTTNYHTFSVFEENKLPARSYFIPYPTRQLANAVSPLKKRYSSEKVRCLNGAWDFKFYPDPKLLPKELDTDSVPFEQIDVPSCWQFRGYERPFYVNVRYQFPYRPPVIPTTEKVGRVFSWIGGDQGVSPRWKDPGEQYNFVGVYRKRFTVDDPKKHTVISFLGVASCMDLYINGSYVGYSEGSHNTAEFDLTPWLQAGENELLVVVHRWCNGTYLECQDMFRNNGIFRDVLLRINDRDDIIDIEIRTRKNGDKYSLTVSALTYINSYVTFSISGHGISRYATVAPKSCRTEYCFENLEVEEWSAENPVLYDVYFETYTCCIRERIGFRTVEIEKDRFLINGKTVKLHGVNHHDTSPKNGYTLTPEEIERDVLTCKAYNIDTIRTSHYPPDPLLLELADQYGLYVVDENDLETHGTWAHQMPPTYNSISHNRKWEQHYLDRITRLYHRDKVRAATCIVMWSLGNEAGGYRNTDAMYGYLKANSDLPVHYEGVIHSKRIAYDVGSEMYPSPENVRAVGEHRRKEQRLNDRPYFLCEYAHAMGVGPGNAEAYWEQIYQFDNLMGGCVWEMVDHAVLHPDGSYTYGGDHGEWEHDGNFCVDGLFYPDRTPSTGAKIIRHIYRPIRVRWLEGRTFELFNTTGFTPGNQFELRFLWNDGTEYKVSPEVEPLCRVRLELPVGEQTPEGRMALLTVTELATGRTVSEETLVLSALYPSAPETQPLPDWFRVEDHTVRIKLPQGEMISDLSEDILLYRAGTDNDTNLYKNTMLPYFAPKVRIEQVQRIENGVEIVSELRNHRQTLRVTDTYQGTAGGILVTSRIHLLSGKGYLPRFGKTFRLDSKFDLVSYVGRTGETYRDMREQFPIQAVSCKVVDMTEPNIKPQESGNRCDCRWAAVSDGRTEIRFEALEKAFELGIKPYSDRELFSMQHRADEIRTGTYVTIQAFQQGIGTASCGPGIAPAYLYPADQDYEMKFILKIGGSDYL